METRTEKNKNKWIKFYAETKLSKHMEHVNHKHQNLQNMWNIMFNCDYPNIIVLDITAICGSVCLTSLQSKLPQIIHLP